jgi:hypothetical protein
MVENYMFILRPTDKRFKTVCPTCAKRGEVVEDCRTCHGAGIMIAKVFQYYVQDRPIEIAYKDRDPKTGVLRYWEDASNFFYETVTPELNKYVPKVPYGIHLCHDTWIQAKRECVRVNKHLVEIAKNITKPKYE